MNRLKGQLRSKDSQLEKTRTEMNEMSVEKGRLQDECTELSRRKDAGKDRLAELQQAIANRDELMMHKQRYACSISAS